MAIEARCSKQLLSSDDVDGNGVEDFIWYDKVDHSYAIWYMGQALDLWAHF